MSLWKRVSNVFRADRLRSEIEEELEAHIAEAMEHGRSEAEARKALGNTLHQREASYALRVEGWLDALRADLIFGWRQLKRNKVTSSVAILSLALAMGACVGAFRLMDAMLWRPLPIAHPERLYGLTKNGNALGEQVSYNAWSYPAFREMREAVKQNADLIAVSYVDRADVTYSSSQDFEKATVVHVSGNIFDVFGLRPQLGRLLTAADDAVPGKAPYAVLTDDYWMRRFLRDPAVVGKTMHYREGVYEIVGVAPKGFTGTTPGTVADVFLPMTMHRGLNRAEMTWFRTLVSLRSNTGSKPVLDQLTAASRHSDDRLLRGNKLLPLQWLQAVLDNEIVMIPAGTGVSDFRDGYRIPLMSLGLLAMLVLLIASLNVANLMAAQAASRAKEMSLRVSIGAGRGRLIQLLLIEASMMAAIAAAAGSLLAWWSAPMIVRMINRPDIPVQLILPVDGRVLGFAVVLTFAVMLLFGLGPALRASLVKPIGVLKGGDAPRERHRWMRGMVGAQVAFCVVVLFVAGLFVTTFQRLASQPTGFDTEKILLLEATDGRAFHHAAWNSVMEHLRTVPGVEHVAISSRPLLGESGWNTPVSVNGSPLSAQNASVMQVSPDWLNTVKVSLVSGRDFREGDTFPEKAIVSETFVKTFLGGGDAVGRIFETPSESGGRNRVQILGVVRDVAYRDVRDPMPPLVLFPFIERKDPAGDTPEFVSNVTVVVKTSTQDPMALAASLRKEVARARAGMHVVNVYTQEEIGFARMIREHLLAMLSIFFGVVALLLASIGLYGVLHYTIVERRKDIGIRLALGARAGHIVRELSTGIGLSVALGAIIGIGAGLVAGRYVASLLYGVKAENPLMLAIPLAAIVFAVLLAAAPAIRRALAIDPVEMLRAE